MQQIALHPELHLTPAAGSGRWTALAVLSADPARWDYAAGFIEDCQDGELASLLYTESVGLYPAAVIEASLAIVPPQALGDIAAPAPHPLMKHPGLAQRRICATASVERLATVPGLCIASCLHALAELISAPFCQCDTDGLLLEIGYDTMGRTSAHEAMQLKSALACLDEEGLMQVVSQIGGKLTTYVPIGQRPCEEAFFISTSSDDPGMDAALDGPDIARPRGAAPRAPQRRATRQ